MYRTGKIETNANGRITFRDLGGHAFILSNEGARDQGVYDVLVMSDGGCDPRQGEMGVLTENGARLDW